MAFCKYRIKTRGQKNIIKNIVLKSKFIILLLLMLNFSYSYATDIPTIKMNCEQHHKIFLQEVYNDIYRRIGEKLIPVYLPIVKVCQRTMYLLNGPNGNYRDFLLKS